MIACNTEQKTKCRTAGGSGGVDGRDPHPPLLGVQRRPDVVDLLRALHRPGQHPRVGDVSDDDLGHAGRAEVCGRFVGADAGTDRGAGRDEAGDQFLALVVVGGCDE